MSRDNRGRLRIMRTQNQYAPRPLRRVSLLHSASSEKGHNPAGEIVQEIRILVKGQPTKIKMKKFLTVWITCSLALAGAAMGQQDEEQQKAKKEKKSEQANEAKPQQKQGPSRREHAENAQPQGAPKPQGGHQEHSPAKTPANENID